MPRSRTRKEAARALRCCSATLDTYVTRGELRAIQIGRRRFFDEHDLRRFIAARRV